MGRVFGRSAVLSRTMEIAERCNAKLEKVSNPFPKFDIPKGYTLDSYFEQSAREGFARRLKRVRALQKTGPHEASAGRI